MTFTNLRSIGMAICLLSAILAPARAGEKASAKDEWNRTLADQRDRRSRFELATETHRFFVGDSTQLVEFDQAERFLLDAPEFLRAALTDPDSKEEPISRLAREFAERFVIAPEFEETRSILYQRDAELGVYRVWNRTDKRLEVFDPEGCWTRGAEEVAIGPPVDDDEIEVYLARLGLLVPENAKSESVPDATPPEESGRFMVFTADVEESRFRFGVQPWKDDDLSVFVTEESGLREGVERGLFEKRVWISPAVTSASGEAKGPAFHPVGIEFRYDANGMVGECAFTEAIAERPHPADWTRFPSEKIPFGWTVLDYRFEPATVYRFGLDD